MQYPVIPSPVEGLAITDPSTNANAYASPIVQVGSKLFVQSLMNDIANAANFSGANDGQIHGITIMNPGSGYVSAPTVTISGTGGSGATATATITGGIVTAITVSAAGSAYPIATAATTVTISASPTGDTATAIPLVRQASNQCAGMLDLAAVAASAIGTVVKANALVSTSSIIFLTVVNRNNAGTTQGTANDTTANRGVIAWVESTASGTFTVGYKNTNASAAMTTDWSVQYLILN
jgi:hypothetical protein